MARLLVVVLALLCLPLGGGTPPPADFGTWSARLVQAGDVALIEERVRIPVPGGGYGLAGTILRPQGEGPFGAIVLNHGVPATQWERRRESAEILMPAAMEFARRGYAVVMPLRRGFGGTGGYFAEDAGPCPRPDYARGEAAAADDVMAAYAFARRLPYVDASRMILAGQSAGAVAALYAAGTRAPKGLVAVLAFAAGRGGDPLRTPGVPCAVEPLGRMFAELGRRVKVPVLFHYSANDLYFGARTSALWYERFSAGGARSQYVLQPPFGDNGHFIFSERSGARYWVPAVERFLSRHQLPFQPVTPSIAT
jgi:dienelactone hydrolase